MLTDVSKSFFISANAGAGKTTNIISRLIALVISGYKPSKILCITYTNAGVNEIKERLNNLFIKILEDENTQNILKKHALIDLEKFNIANLPNIQEKIKFIRKTIKQNLIENDEIQVCTFHAFCKSLIHKFSAETNTYSNVSLIDETDRKIIINTIKNNILADEVVIEDLKAILSHISIYSFENLLKNILDDTRRFFLLFQAHKNPEHLVNNIYSLLNVDYFTDLNIKVKYLQDKFNSLLENEYFIKLESILASSIGSKTTTKRLAEIGEIIESNKPAKRLDLIVRLVCTQSDTKPKDIQNLLTKKVTEKYPEVYDIVGNIQELAISYLSNVNLVRLAKLTEGVLGIAFQLFSKYEDYKKHQGMLDYDDLIFKARDLLDNNDLKDWILFQLDGSFQQILVDEAQDTNMLQWSIINKITEEFFSGQGVESGVVRGLTIVGDDKQSIYSFQGAESFIFKEIRKYYQEDLVDMPLYKSFRSTQPILNLAEAISGIPHFGNREDDAGLVEIIEPIIKNKNLDECTEQLANQISDKITQIIVKKPFLPSKNRFLEPSDIMILFKKRIGQESLICKIKQNLAQMDIKIQDISRKTYEESLPIMDFIALSRYLLYSLDKFSLACVLKSPIFNLQDSELNNISEAIKQTLNDLKTKIDTQTPNTFFTYLFRKYNNLYDNSEQMDLESLLELVGKFELNNLPNTMEHFLVFFNKVKDMNLPIKNANQQETNTIKISTVHSSKGLESPVVILANAGTVQKNNRQNILWTYDKVSLPLFTDSSLDLGILNQIKQEDNENDAKEDANLLYVAITRAMDELYVFAILSENDTSSWYHKIQKCVHELNNGGNIFKYGKDKILQTPQAASEKISDDFLIDSDPQITEKPKHISTISPSAIEKTTPEKSDFNIDQRSLNLGNAVHKVFENIKFIEKHEDIHNILQQFEIENIDIISQKIWNIRQQGWFCDLLKYKFATEVEFTHPYDSQKSILGRIDILVEKPDEVMIIDIKTNKKLNPLPDYIKHQLSLYKDGIQKIFPNKTIKTYILSLIEQELLLVD